MSAERCLPPSQWPGHQALSLVLCDTAIWVCPPVRVTPPPHLRESVILTTTPPVRAGTGLICGAPPLRRPSRRVGGHVID